MGRRNEVEREPDMAELLEPECVVVLAIDRMVRIEPVGVFQTDRAL